MSIRRAKDLSEAETAPWPNPTSWREPYRVSLSCEGLFGIRKEAILSVWNIWDNLDQCVIFLSERPASSFLVIADDFPSV